MLTRSDRIQFTAALCFPAGLAVGLIIAWLYPAATGTHDFWGNVAEWFAGVGALITAAIAAAALRSWRSQLQTTTKHAAANEIAAAASLMRYHFYDARNPLYTTDEWPSWYYEKPEQERSREDEAKAWAHIYNNRYSKHLGPQVVEIAKLRAKALVLLGDDIAKGMTDLAKQARWLSLMFQERYNQIKAGPEIVKQWTNQEFVKRVKNSVTTDASENPDDDFSLAFEKAFANLLRLLKPWM